MARRKTGDIKVSTGNISGISGEVNIAAGDIYKGYTAEQVSVLLTQITSNYKRKPFDGRCPYKGLEVFEEEDAELFFGRERLVKDLLSRVKESRAVFITGPSGSGKSSLVRAGLIHALRKGAIKGSNRWLYETMKPGREPLKELSLAFSRLKGPELADYFQAHTIQADILSKCAESVMSGRKDQRFVLFVDQFEEVFTQINQEEERVTFLNMLAHAGTVANGRVIVLFAMRSDFVSNCATYPAINELLSGQFRQVGAMQREELVSAIALPARHVGLPIEDELIARIINDMKGEPGALPLMQFALKDLFDSQQTQGGVIALTLEDYLKHGGIQKSLERHADASLAALDEKEQELARSIFAGLIEIGRGTQDTKRTALFEELVPAKTKPEEVEGVIQRLADARLIITDEQAGKDTVTIAHEKLLDAWPWLKKLVNENRDVIALQNEIASDAKEWEEHGRDPSYLYSGARLANAYEQVAAKRLALSGLSHDFVQAGQSRQELGRKQQQRRVTIVWSATVITLIIMSFLSYYAIRQAENARQKADIALARQLAAQAQSLIASRNSKQMIAALLSIQSLKVSPVGDAAAFLLNENSAGEPVAHMIHDATVTSVAFSPTGKYVLSGSEDGTARVWDAFTGDEIARMDHEIPVTMAKFSPDGKRVVSSSADQTARVWDVLTGEEIARMTHNFDVLTADFSPNGKYVVSGSGDGTARVWDASSGEEIARITHDGDVRSVAFSPDGKYVVSGSEDTTIRVWSASTGEEIARMAHDGSLASVPMSPDLFYVASVTFSPDSQYVISAGNDGTSRVWKARTGEQVAAALHSGTLSSAAMSPDGLYVVSGGADDAARVWVADTGEEVGRMTHEGWVNAAVFSPNSEYVVSGSDDGTARVWHIFTGKEIARITHENLVTSVAFSPDGKYVVSGSGDGTARVWRVASFQEVTGVDQDEAFDTEVRDAESEAAFGEVVFTPDKKYMAEGHDDGVLQIRDVSTGKEVARMSHDSEVLSIAFSTDGLYVASGSADGTARVWDARTGKEIARMTHDEDAGAVAFSPDGKYVVSGSGDATARVWVAITGEEIARMNHDEWIAIVAFSPDGKYVVSGSADGTARVWLAETGEEIARATHDGPVELAAFSPDSQYLISGTYDGPVRVSRISSGEEIARLILDEFAVAAGFSPDGKYIFLDNTESKRFFIWQPEDLIARACAHMPRNLTRAEWEQYIGDVLSYQAVCEDLPVEP